VIEYKILLGAYLFGFMFLMECMVEEDRVPAWFAIASALLWPVWIVPAAIKLMRERHGA
jgi:hypothetical protein